MPPVDPNVVRERTTALAEQVADPAACLAGIRALLSDYADYAQRAAPKPVPDQESQYKTPLPVLRAIVNALRAPLQADPALAWPLLTELWAGASVEERRLAAELAGLAAPGAPQAAIAFVETCLPTLSSISSLEALAELGLGPLMLADPATYLPLARRWVNFPYKWTRLFGVWALKPLVKDKKWDNVPNALEVIRSVMTDADAEVRQTAAELLRDLTPKSAAEINRFLRENAVRPNNNTHAIIRIAMTKLTAEEQDELTRIMRG